MEQIKIVVVVPGVDAEIRIVDDKVETYQEIIGGHFQVINAPGIDGAMICVNEDGHRLNLPPNLIINGEMIVGPIFFFSTKGTEFVSLTDDQIQQILRNFD